MKKEGRRVHSTAPLPRRREGTPSICASPVATADLPPAPPRILHRHGGEEASVGGRRRPRCAQDPAPLPDRHRQRKSPCFSTSAPPDPGARCPSHPEAASVARRSHTGASLPPPPVLDVLFSPAPPLCREVRRRRSWERGQGRGGRVEELHADAGCWSSSSACLTAGAGAAAPGASEAEEQRRAGREGRWEEGER
jgi:hypothetical protein